jgi:hypothetical protein
MFALVMTVAASLKLALCTAAYGILRMVFAAAPEH